MLPAPAGDGYTPPPRGLRSLRPACPVPITAGVDALVVCGTTGESSTLTDEEKLRLFSLAVQESRRAEAEGIARRHIPVIAGTGSNNTARAVTLSRLAEKAGCDGLLAVTPYYNKANQRGWWRTMPPLPPPCRSRPCVSRPRTDGLPHAGDLPYAVPDGADRGVEGCDRRCRLHRAGRGAVRGCTAPVRRVR